MSLLQIVMYADPVVFDVLWLLRVMTLALNWSSSSRFSKESQRTWKYWTCWNIMLFLMSHLYILRAMWLSLQLQDGLHLLEDEAPRAGSHGLGSRSLVDSVQCHRWTFSIHPKNRKVAVLETSTGAQFLIVLFVIKQLFCKFWRTLNFKQKHIQVKYKLKF